MNQEREQVVVIVDGYSAGRFFVQQLIKRDYKCIHIQSVLQPGSKFYTLQNPHDYLCLFVYCNDITQLIADIKSKYIIINVIAGSESGVELAHQLAQQLCLKRNADELVLERRNKYLMVEALRRNNLNTVEHFKTNDLDMARSWALLHNKWPIVVKPLDSAGSDNVFICTDISQVENAFLTIIGSQTIFDKDCHEVLLQSYLLGNEYVVNLVSCNGIHFVVELRMYHKQNLNGRHMYDYEELIDFTGTVQAQLIDYAKKVADAVGIQYGPSHIEVMLTANGPVLVEIASRISGATHVEVSNVALGYNVVDLTIDSYFDEVKFMSYLAQIATVQKYESIVDIATEQEGYVKQLPSQQFISDLPSVESVRFNINLGDYLHKTISLVNSPAKIHLVHDVKTQIQQDMNIIKQLFSNELKCDITA